MVVTPLSRDHHRNTAIVLAQHLSFDEVLRCDVILDVIDQLGVLTTTRELYLEEAPETFEVLALDSQGNAFSTLESIEFSWHHKSTKNTPQVLKFLSFTESAYHEIPKSMEKFEKTGQRGYKVLLEGINTGSARVSVHLPYAEYEHVRPVEVVITVLANVIIDPLDAYILLGDTISFRILQVSKIIFMLSAVSL